MKKNTKHSLIIFFILFNLNIILAKNSTPILDENPNDKWIAIDKVQHFGYSLLVSLGCQYILVNKLDMKEEKAVPISTVMSFSAGLAKEIQDKKSSFFSKKDMVANFIGISTAIFIIKIP